MLVGYFVLFVKEQFRINWHILRRTFAEVLMLPLNRRDLVARCDSEAFKFFLFYGHHQKKYGIVDRSCFSQWFDSSFTIDGVRYKTAEHFMMASKAELFQPEAVIDIINAPDAKTAKHLGRCIENFDYDIWEAACWDIVVKGNIAKFSQNEDLRDFLLSTAGTILVEASKSDRIWGIGMHTQDRDAHNPHLWRGDNLLGFALTAVREEIMSSL